MKAVINSLKLKFLIPHEIETLLKISYIFFLNLIFYRFIIFLTPSVKFSVLDFAKWPIAFIVGVRFDIASLSLVILITYLTINFFVFFKANEKKIIKNVTITGLLIFFLICMADWILYNWVATRIDSRIFPYFTDLSLMKGGASDTPVPVLTIILFGVLFIIFNFVLFQKIQFYPVRDEENKNRFFSKKYFGFVFAGLFFIVGSRGFANKPLDTKDYFEKNQEQLYLVSKSPIFEFYNELKLHIKLSSKRHVKSLISAEEVQRLRKFLSIEKTFNTVNPLERSLKKCFKNDFNEPIGSMPNIVIFQVESLGFNEFLKLKFLNELAGKSIFANRFHASGSMTHDGVWATLCSVLPSYGRMKNALWFNNFQCVSDELKKIGYSNHFFYAGNMYMDGMNYFVNNHAFDVIFEKNQVDSKEKKIKIGLTDDVLFEKVLLSMKVAKEPFFYYILNLQSHPPGEVPEYYEWPEGTEEKNVFEYFDISIKKFFEKAHQLPFYENTIFIILADHTEHYQTYNDTDDKDLGISLWEFRIPLIIYIPKLNLSNKISLSGFSSQTDIMPTIFDILDIDTTNKGWGESIFCKEQTDKYPTILFSRRQNVISVIKEEQIYSSDFKTFFQNDLLEYDKENPYGFPLKKIKNIDENVIKDLNRFIYYSIRNITSNPQYWE